MQQTANSEFLMLTPPIRVSVDDKVDIDAVVDLAAAFVHSSFGN